MRFRVLNQMADERDLLVAAMSHGKGAAKLPKTLLAGTETLHPTPYTLHSTPYIPHPTSHTQHPQPYTLHPTP